MITRRRFTLLLTLAGLVGLAPKCTVSKEKAVKVTGFVIDLGEEAIPLLKLLGAHDAAELVNTQVLPALEKLKTALSNAEIPVAESALETVRSALGSVATALFNLPESPRRTTILGILASINMLLLTVEAFVSSETPVATTTPTAAIRNPINDKILKVFQASRP